MGMQYRAGHALLFSLLFIGCVGRDVDEVVFEDEASPPGTRVALASVVTSVVAFDPAGRLRFFDATSLSGGVALSPPPQGGPLAFDTAPSGHVAVLARDEEEQSSELTVWPRAGAVFGRPILRSRYEGETYVAAFPGGALVFQDDMGQRWHVATAGRFVPSLPCPIPRSVLAVDPAEGGGFLARALASEQGVLERIEVAFDESRLQSCDRAPVVAGFPPSESARGTVVPGLGDVIADLSSGTLSVGVIGAEAYAQVPFPSSSLEAVSAFAELEGDRPRVGLVALGAAPASLVVVALDAEGRLEASASAPLEGEPSPASRFPSRALAVADARVFVAAGASLQSFDIEAEPLALRRIELPASIAALRAPLSISTAP